jgi:3-phenylpropionate/trans-cinnamate dioxygenase ferredoxin reductase component
VATHSYRYLIVGGGMTADAVCQGIRELDESGAIGLVGEEPHAPYKRPPLTKGLWSGGDEAKIWRQTADKGVELHIGRRVVSIDPAHRRAADDCGDEYTYETLVLATGGRPRKLRSNDGGAIYFRTLDDYRRARDLSEQGARFVVIGGGFIGSEMAAALRSVGCEVTMVVPEPGIDWRTFPPDLSAAVTDEFRRRGVQVLTEAMVATVERNGRSSRIHLEDGRTLEADGVVAGLGIVPNVELAEAAGLPVDDGIVVDERGQVVGYGEVFAAGDVARFPMPALEKSGRVEHEDHANSHGRLVGANAAGADERYDQLPFFYSDLFDFGYEAVGEVDSRLRTVESWSEPNRRGVVAFVDEAGRPRGLLLWGIFAKVDAARELIRAAEPVDECGLRALAG